MGLASLTPVVGLAAWPCSGDCALEPLASGEVCLPLLGDAPPPAARCARKAEPAPGGAVLAFPEEGACGLRPFGEDVPRACWLREGGREPRSEGAADGSRDRSFSFSLPFSWSLSLPVLADATVSMSESSS